MATFVEIIKTKIVKPAFLRKQAALADIKRHNQAIDGLDTEVPNARSFARVEAAANESLEELKAAIKDLDILLYDAHPDIDSDEDYKSDQTCIRDVQFKLYNAIDDYIDVLTAKEITYPPDMGNQPAAPPSDLSEVLKQLVKCQEDTAKAAADSAKATADQLAVNATNHKETIDTLSKHGTQGPKAAQPFFQPKNNDTDYVSFSEFIQNFDSFVLKCKPDVRLQWLKSSLKGEALMLIKHLSPSDANYNTARDRLVKRYNNPDVLKHGLVQTLLSFKAESNPRFTKVMSSMTGFCNALEELKTTHSIDTADKLLEELKREILFYNLPIPIRQGLIEKLQKNYPTSEEIIQKYEEVVTKLNLLENSSQPKASAKETKAATPSDRNDLTTFSVNHKTQNDEKCLFCGNSHKSYRCDTVTSMEARKNILKKKQPKVCTNCGCKEHPKYPDCYFTAYCSIQECSNRQRHTKLYCPKFCKSAKSPQQIHQVTTAPNSVHSINQESKSVALPTDIFSAKNNEALKMPLVQRNIRTLLDSAAQKTLISKTAAERLNLKVIRSEKACLQGYGNKRPSNNVFNIVRVQLGSPYSDRKVCCEAYVVESLNSVHMLGVAKLAKRLESKGVLLGDWLLINSKSDIIELDLLIGADHYWKVLNPYRLPIERLGVWLTPDRWGRYCIMGKIPGSSKIEKPNQINHLSIQHVSYVEPDLRDHLRTECQIIDNFESVDNCNALEIARELNNYDALGFQVSSRAEDDSEALEAYKSNMYKDKNSNQYVVGFPWVNNIAPTWDDLESNYGIVHARFIETMKSLDKNPSKRQQYKETHEKEAAMDFIEEVPLSELKDRNVFKHYINHFPVFRTESATTKCRRVFDASLHKRGRSSLNDRMWKGSLMTPHILKVLLRMRLLRNLFTLDISKAFLRMVLKLSDRNYTCFFFRKNIDDPNSPIVIWRFCSVLFGATSSPFLLNCTIADILDSNDFPFNLEVFVDNLFVLDENPKVMIHAAEKLIQIFEQAAMPLHEFASNNKSANEYFKSKELLTKETKLKLLGMIWDYNNDQLFVKQPEFDTKGLTKRILLSNIARIFDPIGFLNPITIHGRLLVQEAMECSYVWDAKLPSEFEVKWTEIIKLLKEALIIPIPRWIGMDPLSRLSLHTFTDSSDKALGAVVYLVSPKSRVFISSKAKVCPIKMEHFTVPRKELTAMALGTRHLLFVNKALSKYINIRSLHIWSDSTLSLTWCSVKKPHKELFIRARVDDVQDKAEKNGIKLHYIINSSNPADMLTKDTGKKVDDPLWIKGPELLQNPEMWRPYIPTKANVDAIPIFCGNIAVQEISEDFPSAESFATLKELYVKTMESHPEITGKGDEAINLAESLWIKHIQKSHFADIIQFLEELRGHNARSIDGKKIVRAKKLIAPSLCLNLHLTLDPQGIIRIKTSLGNCPNLTYDQKFPILLPNDSPFTNLIIAHSHHQSGHMTMHYTRAKIRNRYWIPKDTPSIKSVLSNCEVCKLERGKRYHVPDSPDLPSDRFDISNPWRVTHLDMTGHYFIKDKYGNAEKVYLIIFVCASTGAGHIEMAMQASVEAFANSFERFCAKNGVPEKLLSDHGSNFMAFSKELQMNPGEISLSRYLVEKKISWEFLPIGDPHFNGYCERALGILKSVMKKAVAKKLLTLDQLMTTASYAQAVFNERPLCVVEVGDANVVPLTPNSITIGRNLRQFVHSKPVSDDADTDFNPSSAKCLELNKKLRDTLKSVHKHWVSEYLSFLARKDAARQKGSPHTKSLLIPKLNDWVLVKDNSRDLRIGKVTEVIKSEDGEIRKVILKINNTNGIYPVTNLRYLEAYNDLNLNNVKGAIEETNVVNKIERPQRKAAIVARSKLKDC